MSTLEAQPKSGTVGEKVTLIGTGLEKSTQYEVLLAGVRVASFKSTAAGRVPSRTSLLVPEVATSGEKGELGAKVRIDLVRASGKGSRATTEFELRASVVSEAKAAHLGDAITVHGKGLFPNENYQVSLISASYVPYAAGVLDSGPNGSGTARIIVPGHVGAGPFQIDLLNSKGVYPALQNQAPIRIIGFSYESLTAGKPRRSSQIASCPVEISIPVRNNTSIPLVPILYALIYNRAKQPVQITSSATGIQPHSASDVTFCFENLQKGGYTVQLFATTRTGQVLSNLTTFSLDF